MTEEQFTFSFIKKAIKAIFTILIVLFLILYLKNLDYSIFSRVDFELLPLLIATIIALFFRFWGAFIWKTILKDLEIENLPSPSNLIIIYSRAWMARYIPGKIASIGGKIYMASRFGVSKKRLAVSSLLEVAAQAIAMMVVALVLLGMDSRLDVIITGKVRLVMILIGLGITVTLYPPIFNVAISNFHRIISCKESSDELFINHRSVLRSFFLYVIGVLISGSAYFFLVISLSSDVSSDMYWYIVGATSLASVLTMAIPLAPNGIGIRDGIMLLLLSIIVPKEVALVITVVARLWSLAVDLLFYLSTEIFSQFKSQGGGTYVSNNYSRSKRD